MEYDREALQTVRETRLLIDAYDAWLYDEFKAYLGSRVLEVGCGLGNQIRLLLDRDLVVGIETSEESVAAVRRSYADYPQVRVEAYSITDPAVVALRSHAFDTALSVNVFEHIDDDELAMRHVRELLEPGANFVLIVPAHRWLYGRMDASIGHFRRYDKEAARAKLELAGFEVAHQKYVNLLGAMGWFVNGRVLRQRVPPTGQLKTLNRLVPALRKLESAIESPVGVSLLTVARRR